MGLWSDRVGSIVYFVVSIFRCSRRFRGQYDTIEGTKLQSGMIAHSI